MTCLSKNNSYFYNIPGYSYINLPRKYSKGGCISILYSMMSHKRIEKLSLFDDVINVNLWGLYYEIIIIAIYCPFDTQFSVLINYRKI